MLIKQPEMSLKPTIAPRCRLTLTLAQLRALMRLIGGKTTILEIVMGKVGYDR